MQTVEQFYLVYLKYVYVRYTDQKQSLMCCLIFDREDETKVVDMVL